jgi:hypothetical protein
MDVEVPGHGTSLRSSPGKIEDVGDDFRQVEP